MCFALVELPFAFGTGEIDVDGLGLGIKIKDLGALFAGADTGVLQAAEGHLRLTPQRR